jgi:hypothetical protein
MIMDNKKNISLIVIVVILSILVVFISGLIVYDKVLKKESTEPIINKDQSEDKTINDTTEDLGKDYSNDISSNWWCTSKTGGFGNNTCLMFDKGNVQFGEPGTDAILDSVEVEKINRISNSEYEIYGKDGYTFDDDPESAGDKYNIVWKVSYNENDNTLTILEGKRTYETGSKTTEDVKAYKNLLLYQRENFYNSFDRD